MIIVKRRYNGYMFKGYEVLERTENYIKLRHIGTGDQHVRYKATCSVCNKDRGWQKKFKQFKKCKSCAQHDDFITSLNISNYLNVNLDDKIIHHKKTRGSETRYKTSCLSCKEDRGYLPLSSANKLCKTCTRKRIHSSRTNLEKQLIAQKISLTQTGAEIFSDFTTSHSDRERSKFKSQQLSKQCFARDDYTCLRCGVRGVNLHAHHVNGFDKFPDQRFSLDNLVTLCKTCHDDFHAEYGKGSNTKEQYLLFNQGPPTKKTVYILTGAPASGKSWVASQLTNFDIVESDILPKKDLVSKCEIAKRPLITLTIGVSTFMKQNSRWGYQLCVIVEDESVINARMLGRNGIITDTIKRRIKRMESLSKQAVFSGTAQEVLDYLKKV